MAISLTHLFASAKADGPDDTLVQPSDWNAEHVITMATNKMLGRSTAGTGAVEEITVGAGLTLATGTLSVTGVPATSLDADYTDVGKLQLADGNWIIIGGTAGYTVGDVDPDPEMALTVVGTGDADTAIAIERFSTNAEGPSLRFAKSRGATVGTWTTVSNNDILGEISAYGAVGSGTTQFTNDGASILFRADEAWTAVANGGRIEFWTVPTGSTVSALAATIGNDKKFTLAGDFAGAAAGSFATRLRIGTDEDMGAAPSGQARLQVNGDNNSAGIEVVRFSADNLPAYLSLTKSRSATPGASNDSPVQADDIIGQILFCGTDGVSFSDAQAAIRATATENWNSGEHGVNVSIRVTPTNSDTARTAVTFEDSGETLFSYDAKVDGANGAYLRAGPTFSNSLATATSGSGFHVTPGGQTVMAFDGNSTPALVINKTNTPAATNVFVAFNLKGDGSPSAGRIYASAAGVVTYQDFCGSHTAPLDGPIVPIMRGTIVSSGGAYAPAERTKRLVNFKVSAKRADKTIYGVFSEWDERGRANIDAVGLSHIRIAKDVTVQVGDLIESRGDGTGCPQDDDIIRSSTVGKVVCADPAETHPDGSYTVAAVLYCG